MAKNIWGNYDIFSTEFGTRDFSSYSTVSLSPTKKTVNRFWGISCVPDLARHVIPVDVRLLEKHVETPFILRKGVAGDFVDEGLKSCPAFLDKALLVNAVVQSKGHLPFQCL